MPENKFSSNTGLNEKIVRAISEQKKEPGWMLEYRLQALKTFESMALPEWGPNLDKLNIDNLQYYLKPQDSHKTTWQDVPQEIKQTFERLGVPEHEQEFFAGVGAQYESEMVYHSLKEEWVEKGIIFLDTDTALKEHPVLFKQYFGMVIPATDNKFAALNAAVWSGGSFIYVPKGVKIDQPLQTYFRIQAERLGQFERTLIIVDEDAGIQYFEGCTAPVYMTASLHAGVVEVVVKKGARMRYMTVQNWSKNVYNLVTKRAFAYRDATVEWIDGNIGSAVTMKYPAVILQEPGAKMEVISVALAHGDQVQDSGAKAIHLAPNTTSKIISKSMSSHGGVANYRGLVKIVDGARGSKSFVQCDSLILDEQSQANAMPCVDVHESDVHVAHEARVSSIEEEQLFYLMSRGLDQQAAQSAIINGFIEPFVKELPPDYAIEMSRLIDMEMESE